tara:strand:- start:7581 stop:8636 length:1056 start_codon:yes stop_codon:yes gene_type:complete
MLINIKNKIIGENNPVFIIAEAGVNHNGSIENGIKLIDIACEAGADAVKFQTFKAEEINTINAPKSSYHIKTTGTDSNQSWFELLKTQELTFEMHEKLIDYCKQKNIIFMSTPYGIYSTDMLEKLNIHAYKIASTDSNNLQLIEYIAKKNKPMFISTAMSNMDDVERIVTSLRNLNQNEFVLLQCTGNYPSNIEDSNLNVLITYKNKFNCLVGYSDHTEGYINAIASTALGISVFEKHFTIDKNLKGPDHRMSLNPDELKQTIQYIRNTEKSLGMYSKKILKSEIENSQKLKKSLISKKFIPKGTKISIDMITSKRPGYGIPPNKIDMILGTITKEDIPEETFFKMDMFIK